MTGPAGPGRPRRRPRRVDAPPTNPEADRSDDVGSAPERDAPPRGGDPRDDWIAEQRPPHWDEG